MKHIPSHQCSDTGTFRGIGRSASYICSEHPMWRFPGLKGGKQTREFDTEVAAGVGWGTSRRAERSPGRAPVLFQLRDVVPEHLPAAVSVFLAFKNCHPALRI